MFDAWTIMHFAVGVIFLILATAIFRWFKVSNALPWAFASSLLMHSVYETKDMLRTNPDYSDYFQMITEQMFGKDLARRHLACTVLNSYCDQFTFGVGMALGLYIQVETKKAVVMATIGIVFLIILWLALVFVWGPRHNDIVNGDEIPPEKYSSLYDIGIFYIVWAVLGSLGTYIVYKNQDALKPVGWAKK